MAIMCLLTSNKLSSPQLVVVRGHNILGFTKRLFTAAGGHINSLFNSIQFKFKQVYYRTSVAPNIFTKNYRDLYNHYMQYINKLCSGKIFSNIKKKKLIERCKIIIFYTLKRFI